MIGNKALIAYTTQGGATEKTAQKIAEVLKAKYGLESDLVILKKQSAPSLEPYRNVIVASGVQQGEIYGETLKFLDQDFGNRKLAYFTCSAFIYPKTYEETVSMYITGVLADYPKFKPVATAAFGGYLKILGRSVPHKMDMVKVEAWAVELGKKLTT
ncbi:flavodoxin domain-containing protein [Candidatus Bathyarchaeota archaeon]|nr:flavodoxin domain-containing protein [Candidatus Bathyarchaeota archaeon]